MESDYRGNLTKGTGKVVRFREVSNYRESTVSDIYQPVKLQKKQCGGVYLDYYSIAF